MLHRTTAHLLLLAVALAGCSDGEANRAVDDLNDDGNGNTDALDTDDTAIPETYSGPSFWSLGGIISLEDGTPSLTQTTLEASFFDSSAQPWQEDELDEWQCGLSITEAVSGPAELLDGEPLVGWWQLSVDAENDEGCPWTVPSPQAVGDTELSQLVIGFGPLDPRLLPSLQAAGLDPSLDLYGLYALHPGSDGDAVYVFGVAGTDEQFAGTGTTTDEAPLLAGEYRIQTLALLPVPEATQR
ncbi:MAG: hypothetical protein AB8H79_00195 [Myxococcota bacterium]